MIKALYAASQAGVKIDLIVRGACALRPGVQGSSDNIRVRSIVGRFLEHIASGISRTAAREDVYLSSADWMGRNLFRRIEVAFPVLDTELKARVIDEGLVPYLADNRDAWELGADGSYATRASRAARARPRSAQQNCCSIGWPNVRRRQLMEPSYSMDLILWRHAEAEPGEPDLGAPAHGQRRQAGRAHGRVARPPSARHVPHSGEPGRSRAADCARARAEIPDRDGTGARRHGRRRAGGRRLARRARARADRRPSADAGRGRRRCCCPGRSSWAMRKGAVWWLSNRGARQGARRSCSRSSSGPIPSSAASVAAATTLQRCTSRDAPAAATARVPARADARSTGAPPASAG